MGAADESRRDSGDELPAGGDPAALLALIAAERERTRRRTAPTLAVLGTVWGVAWLVGYLVLYVTFDGVTPPGWAFGVFAGLLAMVVLVTAVHIARRSTGLRGESATVGAMYGWTWFIGFLAASFLIGGAGRAGAGPELMALVANGVSCLVVGLLYMAGGMLWRAWHMFALGGWITVVAGAASMAGTPTTYLVMAIAGGGGFLVAALLDRIVGARRTS